MNDRQNLPWRKNCEGYFLYDNGEIVAKDTRKGYIEFPGGGIDENETPAEAIIREAYEEAGVMLEGDIKEIGTLKFIWDKDWAKTEKQKERYKKFKGEEMHFFIGKVKELVAPKGDSKNKEQGWQGKRTISIKEAIDIINSSAPHNKDIKEYRKFQLKTLKSLTK